MSLSLRKLKKRTPSEVMAKPKKKLDRFDGLTEEEVQKYTLEDILEPNLDMVFVGINPSLMAAHRGRYYAGPGNHFYKLLHASGLVPRFVSFEEDHKLLNYKIGLTNIVSRPTRSSADLKKLEIKEGSAIVRQKLKIFKPKIAIFNGKCIYEVFADKTAKSEFCFGLQPERVGDTSIWVVPSSSARCAHFPRMVDKLHFYMALKKYLSFLKGEITEVNSAEFKFEGKCKQSIPSTSKMWRRKNVSAFLYGGRVANKDTFCLDTSEENIATVNSTEFIVTEILGGNEDQNNVKGNDSVKDDMGLIEVSVEINSGEEKTSQKLGCETQSSTELKKNRKILKRNYKRSLMSQTVKHQSTDNFTDFVNLIKQRLLEKKEQLEPEETVTQSSMQPVKEAKKLKYGNLQLNSGKKILAISKNASDLTDLDSSAFSD